MSDPLAGVAGLPGVAEDVRRTRLALDALLAHRGLRRHSATVSVEVSLRAALAAAALQDPSVQAGPEALGALRERMRSGAEPTDAALRGAVRVSAQLGPLSTGWTRAPLQVIARLHVLAAGGSLDDHELGRPRSAAPREEDAGLQGAPAAPPPGEVPARLADLAGLLARPTAAPALVVAAVVHGELLALRPFAWGNVVVALAASRLVLATRGLDPRGVSVPEDGHLELGRAAYASAAGGYALGEVGAWVAHCAQALQTGAREGLAVCESLSRES